MVFVSMSTIPVTMETRGLLAVLILIIYCITMRKTVSVTLMMITGFSAPPFRRCLTFVDSFITVICLFTYFSCYIFRAFYLLMHNFSLPYFLFLLYAYSSSFIAIIQTFSKLSSENCKMFIKILKSISSYVHRCSVSLFIGVFKVVGLI